jgi:hypothetical protein
MIRIGIALNTETSIHAKGHNNEAVREQVAMADRHYFPPVKPGPSILQGGDFASSLNVRIELAAKAGC